MAVPKWHDLPPGQVVLFSSEVSANDLHLLNAALDYLYYQLRLADELFHKSENGGRNGIIFTLASIGAFLDRFAVIKGEHLIRPLHSANNALFALEENNVLPCLSPVIPNRRGGRARESQFHSWSQAMAVDMADRLHIDYGISLADARRRVAAVAKKAGFKASRGSGEITERTIRFWRDTAAGDIGHETLLSIYVAILRERKADKNLGQLPKAEAIRILLASLSAQLSAFRVKDIS